MDIIEAFAVKNRRCRAGTSTHICIDEEWA